MKPGSTTIVLAALLLCAPAVCAQPTETFLTNLQASPTERVPHEAERALALVFGIYRTSISSQDGARCGYTPSCSHFGQESIRRFGFQGLLMTSDRLQRCHGCSGHFYPRHAHSGLSLDAVANNVLWGAPAANERRPARKVKVVADHDLAAVTIADSVFDGSQNAYYGGDSLEKFANHLAARGDYYRAAGEYERLLFVLPAGDTRRSRIRHLIGKNLLCAGDAERAAVYFEALLEASSSGKRRPTIQRDLALCDLARGRYAAARTRLGVAANPPGPPDAQDIIGASYLLESRWQEALTALTLPSTAPSPLSLTLQDLATKGLNAPQKSEALAGLYSTLVPGAGKIYTGRTADGIFSFLTIAFCSWQAIRGFEDDGTSSTKGWIFGTLGSGFYAGNIYGSILSARIHNREFNLDLTARARTVIAGLSCDL